ncbi:U32 family peptidase C-terminal domain-containing protein [candidate division KSB1 bacterium]|nr:U32 family peptidase C-terminal domain-containing protein [candidate division KSB1 bacterium]
MKPIELLLPAGDFEKMQFAFAFGADAVYLGVPRYSLRARVNKFRSKDKIREAIEYAHNLGKKVYVTANIFPHNRKVTPFLKFIDEFLQMCQPDAWIISDPGIIMMMKEKHPEQVIHLSVQANTVNYAAAKFWEKIGVTRVILSRELKIEEIKAIKDYCPDLEVEVFVHGAICVAYSGRCLISNYLASRDPNQGTCANSCRWQYQLYENKPIQPAALLNSAKESELAETQSGDKYAYLRGDYYLEETENRSGQFMQIDEDENGSYLMNARDLCAIEYLSELKDAGVDSFKVEGRTKSVYYVSLITRAYRQAIDDMESGEPFNPDLFRDIFSTANKGFTAGFLKGNPGFSAQKFDHSVPGKQLYRFSGIVREYEENKKMIKVDARNKITPGKKLELISRNKTVPFSVDRIFDERFNEVESISGGAGSYWIPFSEKPEEFALLREPIG